MWIGPIANADAMSSMTAERALEMCGPEDAGEDPAGWSGNDFEAERRRVVRSVRNLAEEAESISAAHLIAVDELASWLEQGSPPSPAKMVSYLKEKGHSASVSHYAEPSFRTDAPWSAVLAAMDAIGSAANDR
jgi:tRNA G26 N,N-dimethylase Trm1